MSIINEEGIFKEKNNTREKTKGDNFVVLLHFTAVGPLPSGVSFLLADLCETKYGSTVATNK